MMRIVVSFLLLAIGGAPMELRASPEPQPGQKWLYRDAPSDFLSSVLVVAELIQGECAGPILLLEVRETDGSGAVRFWLSAASFQSSAKEIIESGSLPRAPRRRFTWGEVGWPPEHPSRCPSEASISEALRIRDHLRKVSHAPVRSAAHAA